MKPAGATPRRLPVLLVLVLAVVLLLPLGDVPSPPENPLARAPLYVERDATVVASAMADHPADAAALAVIASRPQSRWFTEATPELTAAVAAYVGAANERRELPVLTLYAVPGRDCGGFSAGGVDDAATYAGFVARVRAGIAGRDAVVVLEPDALTAADCLPEPARAARTAMLRGAVEALTADPATVLYVDAGHSRWLEPAELARRLRSVGVDRARGFSLNVSNFLPDGELVDYGERVSTLLGGAHYVIDSSRNGRGPAAAAPLNWCNPAGRGLGRVPSATDVPAGSHLDAYLWIKRPGESDGTCDRGDPVSGTWFHSYALGLVTRADLG